jgi:hypothetical protein
MGQLHVVRLPRFPAHRLENAKGNGGHGIVDLSNALCSVMIERIAEQRVLTIVPQQQRGGSPVLPMEMKQQLVDGLIDSLGVEHQVAEGAEVGKLELHANQQSEVLASGQANTSVEQPAHPLNRNAIVGVCEGLWVDFRQLERR